MASKARLRSLRSRLTILDTRPGKALAPVAPEQDRKRRPDEIRGSARQRGYDRDWEKRRDAVVIERGCPNSPTTGRTRA